jgi:hypothetical protein
LKGFSNSTRLNLGPILQDSISAENFSDKF